MVVIFRNGRLPLLIQVATIGIYKLDSLLNRGFARSVLCVGTFEPFLRELACSPLDLIVLVSGLA